MEGQVFNLSRNRKRNGRSMGQSMTTTYIVFELDEEISDAMQEVAQTQGISPAELLVKMCVREFGGVKIDRSEMYEHEGDE